MPCRSCGSENLHKFVGEIAIHSPRKDIDKPHVYVRTEIVVCLNCGAAQFAIQEAELRLLQKSNAAGAGLVQLDWNRGDGG
jgi:hypothetical protein